MNWPGSYWNFRSRERIGPGAKRPGTLVTRNAISVGVRLGLGFREGLGSGLGLVGLGLGLRLAKKEKYEKWTVVNLKAFRLMSGCLIIKFRSIHSQSASCSEVA